MSIEIEREPEECVVAFIESAEHVHRDGTTTHFVVRFRRADGDEVPMCVDSTEQVIALVHEMNPAELCLRVAEDEARDTMLRAFGCYSVDVVASEQQMQQRRTLH